VTVNNAPQPEELLVNGGFETGPIPWAFTGAAAWISDKWAKTGSAYAVLGDADGATGTVTQTVAIPSTALGEYRFSLAVDTRHRGNEGPSDYVYVEVIEGSSTQVLASFSNVDRSRKYQQHVFNLSQWVGQTVTVCFRVSTDASRPTTFLVDDVSLR
jgi:hypothetical protein